MRLARPERRNALDAGMTRALLDIVRADPAVPVLIESTDPAAFCAGADLTVPDRERAEVSDLLYQCYEAMVTRPGPVIAVVEGPAVGGGAQLAGAADLRIAGPRGRFRWVGPPGRDLAVGAWLLPDLIGRGAALELTLTGRLGGGRGGAATGTGEPGRAMNPERSPRNWPGGCCPAAPARREREADRLGRRPAGTVAGRAGGEPGGLGRSVTGR